MSWSVSADVAAASADQADQAGHADQSGHAGQSDHSDSTDQHGAADRIGHCFGHRFGDVGVLAEALSHRSGCHEHGAAASNDRLEFLGDAVLGLCVCDHLMERWPHFQPAQLSAVRSAVVSEATLADAARDCDLGSALLLGRGEARNGGADKSSILAGAFEAVLGAVYLDGGLGAASVAVERLLGRRIAAAAAEPGAAEAKTRFQELAAQRLGAAPAYSVSQSGPAHRPHFEAEVRVAADVWGAGAGSTKREAERRAAEAACRRFSHDGDMSAPTAAERL